MSSHDRRRAVRPQRHRTPTTGGVVMDIVWIALGLFDLLLAGAVFGLCGWLALHTHQPDREVRRG